MSLRELNLCLRHASDKGNIEEVKRCLEKGADVHDDIGWPLRWASSKGHKQVCRLLLKHGANFEESLEGAKVYTWAKDRINLILKTRDEIEAEMMMESL